MIIILLLAVVFIPSIVNSVCPPYRKDIVCIDFNQQCTTNYDCKDGNICCSVECGTACKPPYTPPYVDPKCQPVTCLMFCEFGFAKDENGCEICRCNEFPVVKPGRCPNNIDPNLVCPAFVRPGDCAGDGSCPGKRKCCRVGCFHGCVDPEPVCPPVCAIFCEFGNVMDSNGCPTCRCRDNPCPPDPPCPIPPLVPPGECPRRCRFIYKDIGGVSCKVGCEFGPAGPTRPPCFPDNCIRGHIEPPGTKNGSCPAVKPDDVVICAELCSGDDSCPGNKKCCPNGCGLVCMNPIGEHICPIIDCSVPCKHGYELDNYGCQTCICKPYRCLPPPCPPPPKDACIEPQYTIIEGVKCPACYKIVPCKGNCSKGKPLPNVICDDVNRKCPAGYRCKKIHGICCSDCAQINCPNQCEFGFVIDSDGCQTCDCKPSPCIRPPCLPPPEDACTEDEYRIIDGVKCPWCYKIVPCKDKVCPIVLPNSVCYGYTRVCKDDSSCSEGQKCCKQGCSYVCVNPV